MMRILLLGLALLAAASDVSAQYSPTSFGAVVGANQADSVRAANFTAMKACVESAMASKGTVSLPSGTIEIDVPNLGSSAASTLKIKRDLQIIGADRHLSLKSSRLELESRDYLNGQRRTFACNAIGIS